MDLALTQLRTQGVEVRDEDVARLSPLGYGHVNLLGRYEFALPNSPRAEHGAGDAPLPSACLCCLSPELTPSSRRRYCAILMHSLELESCSVSSNSMTA